MTTEKDKTKSAPDLFEEAMRNYEQAFQAGMKLQEDATQWWSNLLSKAPAANSWQKSVLGAADEAVPALQKQMNESLKVVQQCSRSSLDLFQKGFEAARSASLPEAQTKLQQLWESSLQTLQGNLQSIAQLNTRLAVSWTDLARKNVERAESPMR